MAVTKSVILVTREMSEDAGRARAAEAGTEVLGAHYWEGPIPPNSYLDINDHQRMSTAEFYFLRMANQNVFQVAVLIGNELLGHYQSQLTNTVAQAEGRRYLELGHEQATTKDRIIAYLEPIANTDEAKLALAVLNACDEGLDRPIPVQ